MPGESLHEGGITVFTAMGAAHIRIQAVIKAGNTRFGKNGLDLLFPDHKLSSKNPCLPPKGGEVIPEHSMNPKTFSPFEKGEFDLIASGKSAFICVPIFVYWPIGVPLVTLKLS
jgi:hypothetical protein